MYTTCPVCGEDRSYCNIGRENWGFCPQCQVKWLIGENLFSSWKFENEEIWKKNEAQLEAYRIVGIAENEEDSG